VAVGPRLVDPADPAAYRYQNVLDVTPCVQPVPEVGVTGKSDRRASTAGKGERAADHVEAHRVAGEQGLLFDDDVSPLPEDVGYRGPTACNAAGITYRQLDYWARTGLVEPTVRSATGSGTQRLYSFRDVLLLKIIKRLLDAGVSLQQIRSAVHHLRERGTDDLTRVTLMSDGASVYECTSDEEVIDLLAGGQGVFGIAIGGVWREIEGSLSELPSERADQLAAEHPSDELAARRRARLSG
jgi:DNA-binding transcriptional MerR regulator